MGFDKMDTKKLIRGEDRKRLESLTDDLFENLDVGSRDALAESLVYFKENGFSYAYKPVWGAFEDERFIWCSYNFDSLIRWLK